MWTTERPFGKISVETVGVKTFDFSCKCEISKINLYENHGILLLGAFFFFLPVIIYLLNQNCYMYIRLRYKIVI